jgi:hypothetical protein
MEVEIFTIPPLYRRVKLPPPVPIGYGNPRAFGHGKKKRGKAVLVLN